MPNKLTMDPTKPHGKRFAFDQDQPAPQGDEITFPWECEVGGETLWLEEIPSDTGRELIEVITENCRDIIYMATARAIIINITTLQTENARLRAHLLPRNSEGRG